MRVEGTITEVLESWPPEVRVETSDGTFYVALREDTEIVQGGTAGGLGDLAPGVRARFVGQETGGVSSAMTADRVEILTGPTTG